MLSLATVHFLVRMSAQALDGPIATAADEAARPPGDGGAAPNAARALACLFHVRNK
jgi:hypothetical protein